MGGGGYCRGRTRDFACAVCRVPCAVCQVSGAGCRVSGVRCRWLGSRWAGGRVCNHRVPGDWTPGPNPGCASAAGKRGLPDAGRNGLSLPQGHTETGRTETPRSPMSAGLSHCRSDAACRFGATRPEAVRATIRARGSSPDGRSRRRPSPSGSRCAPLRRRAAAGRG